MKVVIVLFGKLDGIYYERLGNPDSDKTLVFVHGAGCNSKFLKPLAKKLITYNCYLINLSNHYKSDKKDCYTAEDYANELTKFVCDLDNVTLIGHSLGGVICLAIASKCLPQVKSIVCISSGAKFDKLDKKFVKNLEKGKLDMIYMLRALGSLTKLSTYTALFHMEPRTITINDLLLAPKIDILDSLSKINVPTLILAGADEILILVEYSEKVHERVKNSKLVVVPNVRHILPIAKKELTSKLIDEFLLSQTNNELKLVNEL